MKTNEILNSVTVSGNIVANASTNVGKSVYRFRIGHSRGENNDSLFLNCILFTKNIDGSVISVDERILCKGYPVKLTGKLRPTSYTDKEGVSRAGIELVVTSIADNALVEDGNAPVKASAPIVNEVTEPIEDDIVDSLGY